MAAPARPIRLTVFPGILPPPGQNAYYDQWVASPFRVANWSLRSQAQLDQLVADPVSTGFTYNPGADTYPLKQDAAKFAVPPDGWDGNGSASISTKQQPRMSLPTYASGSIVGSFDWYWGPEFYLNYGGPTGVTSWKAYQLRLAGHRWWTMMQSPGVMGSTHVNPEVAVLTDEIDSYQRPAGMITPERVTPAGLGTLPQTPTYLQAYRIMYGMWTRYWWEVRFRQPPGAFTDWNAAYNVTVGPNPGRGSNGTWHMVSLWVADELRPARRQLFRVPIDYTGPPSALNPWSGLVDRFDLEQNSSKSGITGPWIGYAKNVFLLRNYDLTGPTPETNVLFERPRGV